MNTTLWSKREGRRKEKKERALTASGKHSSESNTYCCTFFGSASNCFAFLTESGSSRALHRVNPSPPIPPATKNF
ncbi:hypothetical protein L6452_02707 [Arctium lappa]|uniref:Uncharacterized protein n=1 Tax=Arctium lappa TaxID=4217 RepID=A0ACB9FK54_ARCLA|nr:hypothetical protein L6452_02707 [Arctium lappa]